REAPQRVDPADPDPHARRWLRDRAVHAAALRTRAVLQPQPVGGLERRGGHAALRISLSGVHAAGVPSAHIPESDMNQRTRIALALALCCAPAAAAQETGFTVGTAVAARGRKATGVLAVPAGSDAALNIPVAVVHGAKPGKVLAIVSGAHG